MDKVDDRTALINLPLSVDWGKLPNLTYPPKFTSVVAGSTSMPYMLTKINKTPFLC